MRITTWILVAAVLAATNAVTYVVASHHIVTVAQDCPKESAVRAQAERRRLYGGPSGTIVGDEERF
jgi:hypothetical protein